MFYLKYDEIYIFTNINNYDIIVSTTYLHAILVKNAEILRLNAIIQTENMKGNMFVFSDLRTWQNMFEVFQLIKNVRIIVHKKE